MRSAAEETWQGTEAELKELREKIMRDLSRDQALRGLIAHADERYQAIDVRVGRIEGNLANVERAAGTLTAMLGEAAASGILPEESQVAGIVERLEGSLEDVRLSTHALQERVDGGLAQVAALIAGLAGRPRR